MIYSCCDKRRREVLETSNLNGIDFIEVAAGERLLKVHFVKDLDPSRHPLEPDNFRIEGGERIRNIEVIRVEADPPNATTKVLSVEVNPLGDFSTYILQLVQPDHPQQPPPGYDPSLATVEFAFRFNQWTEIDPRPQRWRPDSMREEPPIDYRAKDYSSFRRLLLNRLATVMPEWKEDHVSDLGIALLELLAYVGDHLSYQQDAIATEAYLHTARSRVSVCRHARLIDYQMHDGCNARAWVQVQVDETVELKRKRIQFLAGVTAEAVKGQIENPIIKPTSQEYNRALEQGAVVFEPMHDMTLYREHNEIAFYTWGDRRCCLPRGATRATLKENLKLKKGDVLLFEELRDPMTGEENDSDTRACCAVRLTDVRHAKDPAGDPPVPLTEIEWMQEDALRTPICISARTDAAHDAIDNTSITVARGNIVLTDHGRTLGPGGWGHKEIRAGSKEDFELAEAWKQTETLRDRHWAGAKVPEVVMFRADVGGGERCQESQPTPVNPRFRPSLERRPLTQAALYDEGTPASTMLKTDPQKALPRIWLRSFWQSRTASWKVKRHLLNIGPEDSDFVVEIEANGAAFLRFGDDQHGLRPAPGTLFKASYRIGNGVAGNVGSEAIAWLVTHDERLTGALAKGGSRKGGNAIRNPLPADGGTDPESIQEARHRAPAAFRQQQRAVTAKDYAEAAKRCCPLDIQNAAATFRWTGSWFTAVLLADRYGGRLVDEKLKTSLQKGLEPLRMAGWDIEIENPHYVPLEIEMEVHVGRSHFRGDVEEELLAVLGNRLLPDGQRGLFHPDNLTFGQPVYLSQLYAQAHEVEGVQYLDIKKFRRCDKPGVVAAEKIEIGRLEIARMDNDPNAPEHGTLVLRMKGGRDERND